MTKLPDADWRNSAGLQRVVAALTNDAGSPRIVGGAVRDCLLGLQVTDVDLATPIQPQEVIDRLEAARIKAIPTGIEHGTVTAVADDSVFEITTLRRDVSTDGRRATVAFSDDWKEDAARRDFTINALYADATSGELFDYFGGLDDLKAKRLRFIGDADARIAEDHLRILRYFRFLARFGNGKVNDTAIMACSAGANKLMALSRERIASELLKILALPDPVDAVSLMIEHGIFAPFLPELDDRAAATLRRLIAREQKYSRQSAATTRLLALLPADATATDKVAIRLMLSNRMRKEIAAMLKCTCIAPANARGLAFRCGTDIAQNAALLYTSDADIDETMSQLADWQPPQFPLKGGEIIKMGLTSGPIVAQTLEAIKTAWVEEGFPDRDRLDALARKLVDEALLDSKNA